MDITWKPSEEESFVFLSVIINTLLLTEPQVAVSSLFLFMLTVSVLPQAT